MTDVACINEVGARFFSASMFSGFVLDQDSVFL